MTQPSLVLILDGGGITGAFAAALATFVRETGRRIGEHFDLITGTSTVGIIAIAPATGSTAGEVCRFYEEDGPRIFRSGGAGGRMRTLRTLSRPKLDHSALRRAIAC